MSSPYIGEIRLFAGSFAPAGWAFCAGQLMPISENDTLFTLIGTTYGGDGQETFGIPNLNGRTPIHQGQGPTISQNYQIGEAAGVESVTITSNTTPIHTHPLIGAAVNGDQANPSNALLANSTILTPYAPETANVQMAANAISPVGGSQPHENMQPYLCISYIISLFGIFPTQN